MPFSRQTGSTSDSGSRVQSEYSVCSAAIGWTAQALRSALAGAEAQVRLAVTGRTAGLPLAESLAALGRARTLARLDAALGRPAG